MRALDLLRQESDKLRVELQHVKRLLWMADKAIEVMRRTSERDWVTICHLAAGRHG